jgi:hypothetical protein
VGCEGDVFCLAAWLGVTKMPVKTRLQLGVKSRGTHRSCCYGIYGDPRIFIPPHRCSLAGRGLIRSDFRFLLPNRARCHPRYGNCRACGDNSGWDGPVHGRDFAGESKSRDKGQLYNGRNCSVRQGLHVKQHYWSGCDPCWHSFWSRDP